MPKLRQSLIPVGGRYIVLPSYYDGQPEHVWGNLELPDLSVADASQKYALGAQYIDGDRRFRYGAAKGTLNPDLGAKDTQPQHVAFANIAAAAAQYATEIVIDVAASDGRAGDGVIAVNELAGGYLVVFDASAKAFNRQIKANTAVATGEMTLTLTDPIPVALITDTDHGECMAMSYRYITASVGDVYRVVGMPQLVYTSGQFGWFQDRGPCWIAPQAAVGSGSNNLLCIFRNDGSIDELDYTANTNNKGQIAGFVMQHAQAGGQGAAFIWLTIAP
ncbi:hypothetical protein LCGC14_0902200 [marine sediment metagenome]|uniref:Uncharacterized protein n=1 Tax=marine sediment metagenome TaxID=412755 RepID=A0A0F9P0Y6_9ZZZZ